MTTCNTDRSITDTDTDTDTDPTAHGRSPGFSA
jgi:hypothetical protein